MKICILKGGYRSNDKEDEQYPDQVTGIAASDVVGKRVVHRHVYSCWVALRAADYLRHKWTISVVFVTP